MESIQAHQELEEGTYLENRTQAAPFDGIKGLSKVHLQDDCGAFPPLIALDQSSSEDVVLGYAAASDESRLIINDRSLEVSLLQIYLMLRIWRETCQNTPGSGKPPFFGSKMT